MSHINSIYKEKVYIVVIYVVYTTKPLLYAIKCSYIFAAIIWSYSGHSSKHVAKSLDIIYYSYFCP